MHAGHGYFNGPKFRNSKQCIPRSDCTIGSTLFVIRSVLFEGTIPC